MNRRVLKQLVSESYSGNELDQGKVEKIAKVLKRRELKEYIKALKNRENQMKVTIAAANDIEIDEFLLSELFPEKKIDFQKDPDLLLGVKITDNDLVYNFNLKSRLEKLIEKMKESYD